MKTTSLKYGILIIAAVLFVAMAFAGAASATWDGSAVDTTWYDGKSSPYHISTEAEFAGLAKIINDKTDSFEDEIIYLDSDLDLGGHEWTPIGHYYFWGSDAEFDGEFDGQSHTVSNINISKGDERYIGLFGVTGDNARIHHLRLDGVTIILEEGSNARTYIGALVGYQKKGTIDNCYIYHVKAICDNRVDHPIYSVFGGMVGESSGTISTCRVSSTYPTSGVVYDTGVQGSQKLGGMVGVAKSTAVVEDSFSDLNVQWVGIGAGTDIGGLIGMVDSDDVRIQNCHTTGNVSGKKYVGGLIGENEGTVIGCGTLGNVSATGDYAGGLIGYTTGSVSHSSAEGMVNGDECVGGLIGKVNGDAKISSCSAKGQVDGDEYIGGLIGYDDTGLTSSDALVSSYASGNVSGTDSYVGGLIGCANVLITECYASGNVAGGIYIGGLAGKAERGIRNCHASGMVISNGGDAGGLVGSTESSRYSTITGCYATGNVKGKDTVGGLAGYTNDEVFDSYATGDVEAEQTAGGLIGQAIRTTNMKNINNCSASGNVTTTKSGYAGGLVGNSIAYITNCHATGSVVSAGNDAGGLVGFIEESVKDGVSIKYSYATGNVQGKMFCGGLVGITHESIANSYASGSVSGTEDVGGLAGYVEGTTTNCYATGDVNGETAVGGLIGLNQEDILYCYATGSVNGTKHVGGISGECYGDLIQSSAMNPAVFGSSQVGTLIGDTISLYDVVKSNQWGGIKKTGSGGIDSVTAFSSLSIWNCFPDEMWSSLGFSSETWQANSGNDHFAMPVLKSVGYDTSSDARHLNPQALYYVVFDVCGHGTTPDTQTLSSGEKVVKPVNPIDSKYRFCGWYIESACTTAWDFDNDTVSNDLTLYAKWDLRNNNYTVVFDVQGHGTVPDPQYVHENDLATSPNNPVADGWAFAGWYKESACTNAWDFATDTVSQDTTLYAKWTAKNNLVRFDVQGNGTAPDPKLVATGKVVTRPADPVDQKFTFTGWYNESACTNAWDFENATVSGDMTLYAKWEPKKIVSFDVQGNGTAPTTQYITAGENVEKPIDPWVDESISFRGWYKESACTNAWDFENDTVTADTVLYAKWTKYCPVLFISPLSSGTMSLQYVLTGETIPRPDDPVDSRYTFNGWYTESEGIHLWDFDTEVVTGFMILHANWTPKNYTVTFDTQGSSPVSWSDSYPYDKLIPVPAIPTKDEYTFDGWYTKASGGERWNFAYDVVTGNMTLYAVWTLATYNITVSSHPNSVVDISNSSADAGDEIVIVIQPDAGYSCTGVTSSQVSVPSPVQISDYWITNFTMPNSDVELSVTTAPMTKYAVTVAYTGDGNVTAEPSSGYYGDTITLHVVPASGYTVKDRIASLTWSSNATSVNLTKMDGYYEGIFIMPASAITASVDFNRTVFRLNATYGLNGEVRPDRDSGSVGEIVNFTILPDTGYEVDTFTVNSVDKKNEIIWSGMVGTYPCTITGTDSTANASFKPVSTSVKYAVTNVSNGNGRVLSDVSAASEGDTIRVTLLGDAGYVAKSATYTDNTSVVHDLSLYLTGNSYSAEFSMPSSATTVTGTFEPQELIVTFNIYGTGTVSPEFKNVTYGTSYGTLPTPVREYNSFAGWYRNIEFTGDVVNETTQVTTPGDHTLYAKWDGPIAIESTSLDFSTEYVGYVTPVLSSGVNNSLTDPVMLEFPADVTQFIFTNISNPSEILNGQNITMVYNQAYEFNVSPADNLPAGFYDAEVGLLYNSSLVGNITVTFSVLPSSMAGNQQIVVPQLPGINTYVGGNDPTGSVRIIWIDDAGNLNFTGTGTTKTVDVIRNNTTSDNQTIIRVTNVYDPNIPGFPAFAPLPNSEITVIYPAGTLGRGGTYLAELKMKDVSGNLPSLDGGFKSDIASSLNSALGINILSMVSTANDPAALTSMNSHIADDGINITFNVPKSQISDISQLVAYHIDDNGNADLAAWTTPVLSGDNYTVTVTGDSFSRYVLAISSSPVTPSSGGSSSSHHAGGSQMAPSPTVEPTVEPTSTPVPTADTPSTSAASSTTQPTQQSPAPFVGLIAGLGAAVLFLGRQKK